MQRQCRKCKKKIKGEYSTSLKLDPCWDRKVKFDFNKHCTDEVLGFNHYPKCPK